jgi:hypothetical protein
MKLQELILQLQKLAISAPDADLRLEWHERVGS